MVSAGISTVMSQALLVVFGLHIFLFAAPSEANLVVACYYSNWAQYRPIPGTYDVSKVDPFLCTHMIYAFAKLTGNSVTAYEANDDGPQSMWRRFTELKQRNNNLKLLLAIGGYNHPTTAFSNMAASRANRTEFIESCIQLCRYYNFHGIDMDWEYPETPSDKENFSILIKEMREAFDNETARTGNSRLLLSAAVPAGIFRARLGYDISFLNRYLDLFNLMAYDYHGSWENFTGYSSPLYADEGDDFNVESTVDYYLEQGAAKEKLILGVPLHARTWTLQNSSNTEPGAQAIAGGMRGTYTRIEGVLSYYEVCDKLKDGYTEKLGQTSQVAYAYKDNQWITYENRNTINTKIDYILKRCLGGVMIWAMDLDDFTGQFCGKGSNPLISFIASRVINVKYSLETNTTSCTSLLTTSTATPPASTTASTPATTSPTTSPTTASTTAPTTSPTTASTPASTTASTPVSTTASTPASTTASTATSSSTPGQDSTTNGGTTTTVSRNNGPFKCPYTNGFYPDPTNCSRYYICKNAVAMLVDCRNGEVYNPGKNSCVSNTSYTCTLN